MNPLDYLRGIFQTKAFTAASKEFKQQHRKAITSDLEDAVTRELVFIRSRTRHLYWNDIIVQNAVKSFATNIGILDSSFQDEEGQEIPFWAEAWKVFKAKVPYDGYGNFDSMQTMASRCVAVEGEFFARRVASTENPFVPFELEAIPSANIPLTFTHLPDMVINGIAFANGKPQEYLVLPYQKDQKAVFEASALYPYGYNVYPKEKMIHLWEKTFPDMKRGLPLMTPMCIDAWNRQDLQQSVITQSVNSASFAYALKKEPSSLGGIKQNPLTNVGKGVRAETEFVGEKGKVEAEKEVNFYETDGGSVIHGAGEITLLQSQGVKEGINDMLSSIQQQIATCLYSISFQVDGDCTKFNYSSMRAGLISIDGKVRLFRSTITEPQFFIQVRDWWVEAMLVLHPEQVRPKCVTRYPRNAIANFLELMRAYEVALQTHIMPISQVYDELDVDPNEFNSPIQQKWEELQAKIAAAASTASIPTTSN